MASLILIGCLAVAQLVFQVRLLRNGTAFIVTALTNDDTYYYLQTAWNTVRLGYVTFDGIHSTNGVQSLWFAIVTLLSALTHTKTQLLYASLVLCMMFNVTCYFIIWKLCTLAKQPTLMLLMAGMWSLLGFATNQYSSGMENSIHALLFWCVLWQTMKFLIALRRGAKPRLWIITFLLVSICWVRIDSAPFAFIIFTYCIVAMEATAPNWRYFLKENCSALAWICSFVIGAFAAQLVSFWVMGGSFLPVSALVKISDARLVTDSSVIKMLMDGMILSIPPITPQSVFPSVALLSIGMVGTAIILWRSRSPQITIESSVLMNLACILFLGTFLYHLIIAVKGLSYPPYFTWYRSPSYISWIVILSLTIYIFGEQLATKHHARWSIPLCAMMLLAFSFVWFFIRTHDAEHRCNIHTIRYRAGTWLAKRMPPHVILASWNAGELGYFSDRSVINLDGLVNSVDYYRRIAKGGLSMEDYLSENGVNYIVDYAENNLTSRLPVLRTFECAPTAGERISVWEFQPLPHHGDSF